MGLVLEIKAGELSGKRILVRTGETVLVGRAEGRANFAVPHDTYMSSIHFAIECTPRGCRVIDRGSSNGTYLNGSRVTQATLTDGDGLRSGRTNFSVSLVADEKLPSSKGDSLSTSTAPEIGPPQLSGPPRDAVVRAIPKVVTPVSGIEPSPLGGGVPPHPVGASSSPASANLSPGVPGKAVLILGGWSFSVVPQGWEVKHEFGMQRAERDSFPSNVTATEEMLGGSTLQPFVESQVLTLRQYLRNPRIEATLPPDIPGAEEKVSIDVHHTTKDGQTIFYRRVYARSGKNVGTITLTALEKDMDQVRPAFEAILAGVTFRR